MTLSEETALTGTGELESRIAGIWSTLLEDPDVSPDISFFEAGGDSILLIVLLDELRELGGREIDATDLFTHSTIRAQADFLSGRTADAVPVPVPASRDRSLLRDRSARVSHTGAKDHA
ncbi:MULTISPECIES: phosphopantetheine-binding protein [unclassified Streptomyces]|uniref:phosphopantetheine-binding protein n=1 Tax=unclassified Streptomyces TaxID=2593676 RepID=UPI00068F67D5|nr:MULTISPECIES: phosphopantetheine-binding protein [unclassified Streptomyces]